MVEVAVLEEKAARLRDQAAKLHRADSEAGAETYRKVGQQKDEANRQLRSAKEAVEVAEAQAKEQHDRAQEFEQQARDLEAGADDEFNKLSRISEGDLEQAQKLRALAAAATERAAESHRAATRHQEDAQRLEQQISGLQSQVDIDGSPTEKLADQLDDMVDRLTQAAANLREADQLAAAGNAEGAEAMRGQAARELEALSAITPAYTSVDAEVLRQAGITAADTDLMDPTLVGGPEAPRPEAPPAEPKAEAGVGAVEPDAAAPPDSSAAETTAVREPTDLEAEIAALRTQATKLHSEAVQRFEKSLGEAGGARDEAAAEAWALRQKAKAADIQATREHREAAESETKAAEYEATAAKLEQAGNAVDAEDHRETAGGLRAMARSHTARAKEAEQRAKDALDQVEPLDQRVRDYEADKDFDRRPQQIEQVADQVDDKVRLLEEAVAARAEALRLREAGDTDKAVQAAQRAVDAQAKADALQPEYDKLEADVRAVTGIEDPAIEMEPGAMRAVDPTLLASPDPVAPTAAGNMQPSTRTVGTGPDSDGDGLSDDFETNVFFSDPTQKDVDGDGLSDLAEYWLDTKPKLADSDGDGWEDGEDLAFGDPLRPNAGGAERADLLRRAREQFEREGSDRDKDLVRDHLEKQHGTKVDDADSDGDGLGDMVELQLKTDPLSPAGSTADLDTARARLDPRRAITDAPPAPAEGSSNDIPAPDVQQDLTVPEEPTPQEPTFEEPEFMEPVPADLAFAEPDAVDPAPDAVEGEVFDA